MSQTDRLIIGTAGHIDHGKSALIQALTGQETDRLPAEKERGISIELGFAHYELDDHRFGVVDVPGHERFIRQMLAGAHGIDLVLFTIAADDGIMPQTEEHFDILHLLGAAHGIFVITKTDLAPPEKIDELRSDIEVLAVGTDAESWPVLAVSSHTGDGLTELREELGRQLAAIPTRSPQGYFRLPIDRAFSLHGHGLVVTGTAIAGSVEEGDALTIHPGELTTRARSIQVHGESVSRGSAGQRVAVNLAGLEREQAKRGQWLTDPRVTATTDRVDCFFELRPGAPRPLKSFDRVRLYIATTEVMGRVILLGDQKEITPKSSSWCQIALDEPILASSGDRFVVRTETGTRTTGGGSIVLPFASRHRKSSPSLIADLETLRCGPEDERIRAFLDLQTSFAASTEHIAQALDTGEEELIRAAQRHSALIALPSHETPEAWTTSRKWQLLEAEVEQALQTFHRAHPIAPGMDLESLRSRLRTPLAAKLFRPAITRLEEAGIVVREEASIRLPSHRVKLDKSEERLVGELEPLLAGGKLSPPDVKQCADLLGQPIPRITELLLLLEKKGRAVRVTSEIFYSPEWYGEAEKLLHDHFSREPEITVAQYRTALEASRKYALALLEHFDDCGLTVRVGDARKPRAT